MGLPSTGLERLSPRKPCQSQRASGRFLGYGSDAQPPNVTAKISGALRPSPPIHATK